MYPDIYRWFEECYRRNPFKRKGVIACDKNKGLGQSQKEPENQQRLYKLNENVFNDCMVARISIEGTPNDKDYIDYNTIQFRDTSLDKNRDRSTTVQSILVAKKNKLNKDDLFNSTKSLKRRSKTLNQGLGIDNSNETTHGRQSTGPAAALSYLNKPTVPGKTESQLEQSNASRRIDSQRNPKVITIGITGDDVAINSNKQEPIYPDDSCDLYSEKASEDNLLDSEPLVTDETPGVDESPAISIVEDDATSDGEESTDSDYDFEMMKLFAWLDKKDWAKSYYDSEDGVVIHVEPGKVEASQQLVAMEFPNFHKYSIVETDLGVCRYCADPIEEGEAKSEETNQTQTLNTQNPAQTINTQTAGANSLEEELNSQPVETHSLNEEPNTQLAEAHCSLEENIDSQTAGEHGQNHAEFCQYQSPTTPASQSVLLQPGYTITSDEHPARFSGRVGSKGLTVAHIVPSNTIHHYCNDKQHLIGTMEKFLEVDVSYTHQGHTTNLRTTADLGVFDLEPYCLVRNIICHKYKGNFSLKLYRGNIRKGTLLMIIDRNGDEKLGKLTSEHFILKRNKQDSSLVLEDDSNRKVYNMLRIQNVKSAISAKGDSGTLVTSIPKEGTNELFVYGIVTHLHKEDKCEQGSSTIANRLPDVLKTIDINTGSVGLGGSTSNSIVLLNTKFKRKNLNL